MFRDAFSDSPLPNKSTVSCPVNRFHDSRSVQDRIVPLDIRCCVTIFWTISVKLCYPLDGSNWGNFLFRVDLPSKVYIRLKSFKFNPFHVRHRPLLGNQCASTHWWAATGFQMCLEFLQETTYSQVTARKGTLYLSSSVSWYNVCKALF